MNALDDFSAEHGDETFTIHFTDGHALTAWRDGRLIITKAEAGFTPFVVDIAAINAGKVKA